MSNSLFAQEIVVRNLHIIPADSTIAFPVVEIKNSPQVAQKINDFLQIEFASQTIAKSTEQTLFDSVKSVWGEDNHTGYLDNLDYSVTTQNNALLSFNFTGGTVAAYPDFFESAFTFNVSTGDIIYLEDLFTDDGFKQIKKRLLKERRQLIKLHMASLEKDKEYKEMMTDVGRDLFIGCLDYDYTAQFMIKDNKLVFLHPRCLPHVIEALDGNFEVSFSVKEITPFLNSYGKTLLIEKLPAAKAYHKTIYTRPLYGKIGEYPIVMYLNPPYENEGNINAFYYYLSQGIKIELFGSYKNGKISLSSDQDELFVGTISQHEVSGIWKNKGKELTFKVR